MKNFNVGLNREQAHRLRAFCDLHSKENFLFVKDKELYFLAATEGKNLWTTNICLSFRQSVYNFAK